MGMDNNSLTQILATQDGVISLQQAFTCGLSDAAVRWRVSSGSWRRLSSGIFHAGDSRLSPASRLHAAVLSGGKDAVVYGPSAAWWLGLVPAAPLVPWITIPSARLVRRNESMVIRRRNLDPKDVTEVRGLAVTAPELTVLETAVEMPEGSAFLDQMLLSRVRLDALAKVHVRNAGRRGSRIATKLLDAATSGGLDDARRRLVRTLSMAGLPGWEASVHIGGYVFDAGFPSERIGIEVDGWASHPAARRGGTDFRRHNVLIAAGWSVLRFDWHRLDGDPKGVAGEIRAALVSRQRRVGAR